ncbi:MAG TPA: glycosyltransferase family 4 protein [Thermoanaerobaculia bacterium]|nr:glycosyltransferase family 4 protein [Thermoanaerobaculia bacterium]
MRILLLAPHPFFQQRGTPIAERMLLEVLAANGHEIDVLTFAEGEDVQIPGCRFLRIPRLPGTSGIRPGFSWKKLANDAVMLVESLRLIRRHRYNLVHAVEESAFMALVGKWLFRVPYVYDMDSGLAQQMIDKFRPLGRVRPLLEVFERSAARGSAGVLAVCRSLEEQARAWNPGGLVQRIEDVTLLEGNGKVLHLGTDLQIPLGLDGVRPPVVMYVGNLEPYQGIDLLIEAFRQALRRAPRALLVLVGGAAGDIERYRERAERLGITASVHFAGPRPVERLGSYLRQATVLVSPRIHGTNTPMKVYSYLDSGRPLLATRLPTHTQVLTDDVALLVEPEPEAMSVGLVSLLEDEVLRERLADNARELAQREFTPQAFERKLLNFYDAVTEKTGGTWIHGGETARLEAGRQSRR